MDWQALAQLPQHLAVVMDGNGRWAKAQGLPRRAGHKAGVAAVRRLIASCLRSGIPILTLFAFSQENWQRPASEVRFLMQLLSVSLEKEIPELVQQGVKLTVIGDKRAFAPTLNTSIALAQSQTAHCSKLHLQLALNYSGRWDILNACETLLSQAPEGPLTPAQLEAALQTAGLPDPDLLIRTSGEKRLSNFLLWQMAYTELYFTDTLWPDFDEVHFYKALEAFAARERRFGNVLG